MATLIDDAIAIFPSWLKELPVIIIIESQILLQCLIQIAYMLSRLMLYLIGLYTHHLSVLWVPSFQSHYKQLLHSHLYREASS